MPPLHSGAQRNHRDFSSRCAIKCRFGVASDSKVFWKIVVVFVVGPSLILRTLRDSEWLRRSVYYAPQNQHGVNPFWEESSLYNQGKFWGGDKRAPFERALCSSWYPCIAWPFLGLALAHFDSLSVEAIERGGEGKKAWKGGVRRKRPKFWQRTKCTFERCTFVPSWVFKRMSARGGRHSKSLCHSKSAMF